MVPSDLQHVEYIQEQIKYNTFNLTDTYKTLYSVPNFLYTFLLVFIMIFAFAFVIY